MCVGTFQFSSKRDASEAVLAKSPVATAGCPATAQRLFRCIGHLRLTLICSRSCPQTKSTGTGCWRSTDGISQFNPKNEARSFLLSVSFPLRCSAFPRRETLGKSSCYRLPPAAGFYIPAFKCKRFGLSGQFLAGKLPLDDYLIGREHYHVHDSSAKSVKLSTRFTETSRRH